MEEDWLAPSHRETPDAPIRDMTITVGWNAAVKAGVTREEMDAWAFRSHMRAVAGIDAGSFTDEIFPHRGHPPRRDAVHLRGRRAPQAEQRPWRSSRR